jgi:hypothetical protein
MIFVKLHKPPRECDGLRLAAYFQHPVPTDQFLGFGERTIYGLTTASGMHCVIADEEAHEMAVVRLSSDQDHLGRSVDDS